MTTNIHSSFFITRVLLLIFILIITSVKCSVKVQLDSRLESGLFLQVPDEEQDDPIHGSSDVTRFFTLLQPNKEVSVRASFGPISVRETIFLQREALKQQNEYESNGNTDGSSNNKPVKLYHNEDYTDLDFDLKEVIINQSRSNSLKPVVLTLPGQGFDVSGHLVKKEITRNNPVVQVLFYAGHSHHQHQHLPSTYPKQPSSLSFHSSTSRELVDESIDFEDGEPNEPEGSTNSGGNNILCAVVIVSKEEEKVFGVCSPSYSREGSCIASVTLPSSWWPPVTFNSTKSKRYKSVAASVDYILVKGPSCSESSLGMTLSAPDHLIRSIESLSSLSDQFPVGSVNQLQEVKLSLYKGTYEEVANDNMIKILIPHESTHPNARMYIPVTFKPSTNYPVSAFSVRVKIKSGVRVLGAQVVPFSPWQISFETSSKGNVATVTCFLRDQDIQMNDGIPSGTFRKNSNKGGSKASSSGFVAEEIFSFLFEVDDRADVLDSGRMVWQLLYITDTSNSLASAPTSKVGSLRKEQSLNKPDSISNTVFRRDFLDRESFKLTSKLDVGKDEVTSIIGVSKSNQMLNTAILTGKQVSQPLKVFVVSKSGRSGDVTLQSTCHSLDESSLKVSQSCTSVYLDGSEIRPSVNSTIIIKYGSFTGYTSFVVWTPKIPLEIKVGDSKLSQIKGWRIPHTNDPGEDSIKTIMKNKKRKRSSPFTEENRGSRRGGMKRERNSNRGNEEEEKRGGRKEDDRMSADNDYGHVVHSSNFNNLDSVYNFNRLTDSSSRNNNFMDSGTRRKGVIEESVSNGQRQVSSSDRSKVPLPNNQHNSATLRNAAVNSSSKSRSNSEPLAASSSDTRKVTQSNSEKNGKSKMMSIIGKRGQGTVGDGVSGTTITSPGSDDNNNHHSNLGSLDTNNCRLRYQQTEVKVLTKFYTNDHESGRETYLSSRGNYFDVTYLVSSNIRILDPRILSFRSSSDLIVIEGLNPGKTQVQVMSPITGLTLGVKEVKVAVDRETITHLDIDLITGIKLQIFPYSDFSDNIWVARVTTTDRLSSLYQEGLFDVKLHFSDGSVTSLDSVSAQDYHLSIDIFHENRAIAIAPPSLSMASNSYPRLIAINEGKDQLIHISLEVPQVCQRKRTQQLAMSYLSINVNFSAVDEGSSLINLQQNDAFSKMKKFGSKFNRSKNSLPSLFSPGYSYSSSSLRSTSSNTGPSGISSSSKDFNHHRERILKMILSQSESDDSVRRVVDPDNFDPTLYYHNLTPLEIGMYSLLVIFSLAVVIFIFSCLIFAFKFRNKSTQYSLPHYFPPHPPSLDLHPHPTTVVTNIAHIPPDHPHHQLLSSQSALKVRGRDLHKNLDLSSILRKPLIDRSLGQDTEDNDWVFLSNGTLEQNSNTCQKSFVPSANTRSVRNTNPLINDTDKGRESYLGNIDSETVSLFDGQHEERSNLTCYASDPIVVKLENKRKCDSSTRQFHSDDTFDACHPTNKKNGQHRTDTNASPKSRKIFRSSSFPHSESEVSIRITTNPFRDGNEEVEKSEQSDILSDSSLEPSHHEEHFGPETSSEEEYRDRRNCSSDESDKRNSSSRLRRKQVRTGHNAMQFKASTAIRKNRYYFVIDDSLQRSAVEGQSSNPPVPARRHTLAKPPPVPDHKVKDEDSSTSRVQSSCGSDVEYLYGVVMKDKKTKKAVPAQSSTESEEPSSSSGFGPPTSALVSDNSIKKDEVDEKVASPKLVRHPQATCSSAPDVPDHALTALKLESEVVENKEEENEKKEEKAPPVPRHAPRRPAHRVNYSRTAGKMSSRPPPIPAHSDTMKLSSSPCNKPLPPSPSSRKSKDNHMSLGASAASFNRARSHSRPKSLSLKSTFQVGLSSGLPHPHIHIPSGTRRVDSRNVDKEWEQATKGMNYNQLMEYFNNLKESSA